MLEADFATLTFSFTVYYFIERCLRLILMACNRPFYDKLRVSRKDLVFFGIWMGLLITSISTPFCVHGAQNAWRLFKESPANGPQVNQPLDLNAKVCIAARSVLWVSELNRLDLYGLYVIHHAGSIISLLSFLYFEWSAMIFLTIYSTLVSEIPGDLVWMVSSYIEAIDDCSPALKRFKSRLVAFNVAQYAVIRGMGLSAVFWLIKTTPPLHGRPILEQIYGYTLLGLYALFCASYIYRQSNSMLQHARNPSKDIPVKSIQESEPPGIRTNLEQEWSRPIHLRIGENPSIIIVPYGFFMGIGFAALVFVSLTFGAPSHEGLAILPSALNITLVSAVFFARLLSIIMEDGISALVSHPARTLLRPGFWLHGGLFGATAGAVLAYKLGYVQDFPVFAGSLAVGLPIYETFSRIGCHTYGCCYGRVATPPTDGQKVQQQTLWHLFPYPPVQYNHPTHYAVTRINPTLLNQPLIPIQLISATLFFLLFLVAALPLAHYTSVEVAGAITLILHAMTRLVTEPYRADYRGRENRWVSMTGKMALLQAMGGLIWLVGIHASQKETRPMSILEKIELSSSFDTGRLRGSLFAAVLGIIVYGVHIGEIGSWVSAKAER